MQIHSRARSAPSSSSHRSQTRVAMSTSPRPLPPHYSPPGSPLPKRPQTALATAFRKSPTPLVKGARGGNKSSMSAPSLPSLQRSMSEPFNEKKGSLLTTQKAPQSPRMDVVAWEPPPSPRPEKVLVCYYCQREFTDALSLTKHSRTHGGKKPYSCTHCGRTYALYSSLMTHEKSHETPERSEPHARHRCGTCRTVFLHETSLKAHVRRHEEEQDQHEAAGGSWARAGPDTRKPYQCSTCYEWASDQVSLKIHMQRHEHFPAPRVCTLCGTTFSCDAFLRAHGKLHEAEATMKCVICVRPFRRSRVLLRHSDVHADGRHNVCDSCEKRFPKVADGSWRRMKLLGPEERRFHCLYCGVTFSRLHQLAVHEAHHTDLPPLNVPALSGEHRSPLQLPSVFVN